MIYNKCFDWKLGDNSKNEVKNILCISKYVKLFFFKNGCNVK